MTLLQINTADRGWEVWAQLHKVELDDVFVYIEGILVPGRAMNTMQRFMNIGRGLEFRISDGDRTVVEPRAWEVSGFDVLPSGAFSMTMVQT